MMLPTQINVIISHFSYYSPIIKFTPCFFTTSSGTINNQIVRIRDGNNKVSAHKWSAAEEQWVRQDVLSGPPTAKKTEYEGKVRP